MLISYFHYCKRIFNNKYFLIVLIIILAYILRILPYLLGYPIPFTEDGINDFNEVKVYNSFKHLIIPSQDYYTKHSAFPILRLTVLAISKLGIEPLKVFLFFPQIFPSLGILFYFLFLKKYFSVKASLLACFLIAVFGPHIYWSSQPVIETMGLFFFPLIIYLFDKEASEKKNIINSILLFLSFILIIASHHWSTFMALGWLFFYTLAFTENRRRNYSFLLISIFLVLSIIYWFLFFPMLFTLLSSIIKYPLAIIFLTISIFIVLNLNKIFKILQLLNNKKTYTIPFILLIFLCFYKILPISYPVSIWFMFFLFILFFFIGTSFTDKKIFKFLTLSFFFFLIMLCTVPLILYNKKLIEMPLDPFRTLEFVVFPISIICSLGIFKTLKTKKILFLIIILFSFTAIFTYPPIFIFKNNFEGTVLYDIRSDIRYLSPETINLIKLSKDNGYNLIALSPEARAYQNLIGNNSDQKAILLSKNDLNIIKYRDKIKDPIMRINNLNDWQEHSENIFKNTILQSNGNYVLPTQYDSKFIYQSHKGVLNLVHGQPITFSFRMKNTGLKKWSAGKIYLKDKMGLIRLKLLVDCEPGEEAVFELSTFVKDIPENFKTSFRMYSIKFGSFGEITPETEIIVHNE